MPRSWRKSSPRTLTARRSLKSGCRGCFLSPRDLKYPICGRGCRPNCQGILAAYRRARQYKNENVARKALSAAKRYKCSWRK